jgi:GcrA cell cycle regulator
MPRLKDGAWTEAETAHLLRNWSTMSASQIAQQLPGRDRNAVLGKIDRLRKEKRLPNYKQQPKKYDIAPKFHRGFQKATMMPPPPTPPPPPPVPLAEPCDIHALNEYTCRWPIGDPRHPDFYFCGARPIAGSIYCYHHTRLAFAKTTEIDP